MGQIEKAAESAQLQKPKTTFEQTLKRYWPRISAVMPKAMNQERMFQLAVSCYNQTPELAQCSPQSVMSCLMRCSALGMEPSAVDGLGRAYIIPFNNRKTGRKEATFILGYKGMIDLARRSGQIRDISARAVHDGDEFRYEYGLNEDLVHIPSTEPVEKRPMTHVYMVAHFKDGGHYIEVMSKSEVDAVRGRSRSSKSGPWVTDYEAMALKTVIRRAFRMMPVSVEAAQAVQVDDTTPEMYDSDGLLMFGPSGDDAIVDPETGEILDEKGNEDER